MPHFETSRRVHHAPEKMFELVADVERYPEFVPLCESLKIRRRERDAQGHEVLVADMSVAYKMVRETFTSRVTLDRPALQVRVEYVNGPFRTFETRWGFRAAGEGHSEVMFRTAYEFKNRTLGFLMGALFEAMFRRFADAFERRADQVYGVTDTVVPASAPAG